MQNAPQHHVVFALRARHVGTVQALVETSAAMDPCVLAWAWGAPVGVTSFAPEGLRLRLQANAPAEPRWVLGRGPAQDAAAAGSVAMLQLLADAGARLDAPAGDTSPLALAIASRRVEAIRFLLHRGVVPSPLERALAGRAPAQIRAMLGGGSPYR